MGTGKKVGGPEVDGDEEKDAFQPEEERDEEMSRRECAPAPHGELKRGGAREWNASR